MALPVWTRALEPEAGDPVTSRQYNSLAESINQKLLSGIGDGAWRLCYAIFSLQRQIRNPDNLAFGAQDEWLWYYAHLPQDKLWPAAAPGEATGLNLANPLNAFVFGSPSLTSEDDRLFGLEGLPMVLPTNPTNEQIWELGKRQAGLISGTIYDPSTIISSPWLTASQTHYKILPNNRNKMLLSYGGFMSTPRVVALLRDPDDADFPEIPIYQFKFTDNDGSDDRIYYGFRQGATIDDATGSPWAEPGDSDGLLAGLFETTFSFYLLLEAGTIIQLSKNQYSFGPHDGSTILTHGWGHQLDYGIHRYSMEYRGSDFERADGKFLVQDKTFDFEKFWKTQLLVAPRRGIVQGTDVVQDDVRFFFTGEVRSGDSADTNKGAQFWTIPDGFACQCFFIKSENITQPLKYELAFSDGGRRSGIVPQGDHTEIVVMEDTHRGTVELFARSDTRIDGMFHVELRENVEYKPFTQDVYLAIRGGSADEPIIEAQQTDGTGFPTPRTITDDYFARAAITARNGSTGIPAITHISQNAVYESMRKWINDMVRMVHRTAIKGYRTDENGRSVITCDKFAFSDSDTDVFADMTGEIEAEAPDGGFTNQWVCFFSWSRYDTGSTSEKRLENTAEIFGHLNNPLFWRSSQLTNVSPGLFRDLGQHFVVGIRDNLNSDLVRNVWNAEAPSGYNFAKGTNDPALAGFSDADKENFYRSATIYKPPYLIDEVRDIGNNQVELHLNVRLESHEDADASISSDISSWNLTDLGNQDYAMDENRLQKYLVRFVLLNSTAWPAIIGDYSPSGFSDRNEMDTGAIIPRLHMVKLMRLVPEDGNDDPNPGLDACFESDDLLRASFYLRHMCEGFVDNETTNTDCVNAVGFYDYRWETICQQANEDAGYRVIPDDIRDFDNALGWAPYPGMCAYEEQFAQLARINNKLLRARLDVPAELESIRYQTNGRVNANPFPNSSNYLWHGRATYSGFSSTNFGWTDYLPASGEAITVTMNMISTTQAEGEDEWLQWRYKSTMLARFAFPEEWRDDILDNPGLYLELIEDISVYPTWTAPGPGIQGEFETTDFQDGVIISGPTVTSIPAWSDNAPWDTIRITEHTHSNTNCFFTAATGGIVRNRGIEAFAGVAAGGNLTLFSGAPQWVPTNLTGVGLAGADGSRTIPGVIGHNATIGNGNMTITATLIDPA